MQVDLLTLTTSCSAVGNATLGYAGRQEAFLTDLLGLRSNSSEPSCLEIRLSEAKKVAEENSLALHVYGFARLLPGQTLMDHILQYNDDDRPGPTSEVGNPSSSFHPDTPQPCFITDQSLQDALLLVSERARLDFKLSEEEARRRVPQWWRDFSMLQKEWQTHVRNVSVGNYAPFVSRAVVFGECNLNSRIRNICHWPAIIIDSDGSRQWGESWKDSQLPGFS